MNIVNEEQLDFDDVMIVPQPSTIESRKDTIITKPYTFKWTGKTIEGNPAMAANMATTGTFEMARELQKHQMLIIIKILRITIKIFKKRKAFDLLLRVNIGTNQKLKNFITFL